LMPPWESARIVQAAQSLRPGEKTIIETRILGLFTVRWEALHTAYDPPRMFEDVQLSGPFRKWCHRHLVSPHERGATLRDDIEYEPPLWPAGRLAAPLLIVPRLKRLFDYRHRVTKEWAEKKG
jgi:uncharacterized protein